MFFENDATTFNILDILELKQKNINIYNINRKFNALSFRIKSDAVLESKTDIFYMNENYVSFVPSGLEYRRISKLDELIVIHFDIFNCNANNIEAFLPKNPKVLKKLFVNILECWNKKDICYKYNCSAIFNNILALCCTENYNPNANTSKIQKSVDYLLKHYNEPTLTIGEIANQSFMSEVYFRKLFKEEYGTSPQKYITHLKIRYAKELIYMGYYSLKEIALMSGYTDYKYFSTEFKKHTGLSPSDYIHNDNK